MAKITEHDDSLGFVVLYGTTDSQHVTYNEAQAAIDAHGLFDAIYRRPRPYVHTHAP